MIPNPKMILTLKMIPKLTQKWSAIRKGSQKIDPEMMSSTEGIPQLDPEMITQHANGKYLQAQIKKRKLQKVVIFGTI